MNAPRDTKSKQLTGTVCPAWRPHRSSAGSAVLVVFMVLAVVGVLIICNTRILYSLKQELRMVEEKQLRKFAPAAVHTNPQNP